MPGDDPLLAATGQDRVLVVLRPPDLSGHELREDPPDAVPQPLGQEGVEPALPDDLPLPEAEDLAALAVDQGHPALRIQGHHHHPGDVEVGPRAVPLAAQGLLGLPAIGDVEGRPDESLRLPLGVANHLASSVDPAQLPGVLPEDLVLDVVGREAIQGSPKSPQDPRSLAFGHERAHLVQRVGPPVQAVDPRELLGQAEDLLREVPLPDADAARRLGQPGVGLAPSQGPLRPHGAADVHHREGHPPGRLIRVERSRAHQHIDDPAVLVAEPGLHAPDSPLGDLPVLLPSDALEVLVAGVDHPGALPDQLASGVAHQLAEVIVDLREDAVDDQADADRRHLADAAELGLELPRTASRARGPARGISLSRHAVIPTG